jgi:hypothetical protein
MRRSSRKPSPRARQKLQRLSHNLFTGHNQRVLALSNLRMLRAWNFMAAYQAGTRGPALESIWKDGSERLRALGAAMIAEQMGLAPKMDRAKFAAALKAYDAAADTIRKYLKDEDADLAAKGEPAPVPPTSPTQSLIDAIYAKLEAGESPGNVIAVNKLAEQHLGASRVSGA